MKLKLRSAAALPASARVRLLALAGASLALLALAHAAGPQPVAARSELVDIFNAVRALRQPRVVDGVPDYTAAATNRQKQALSALRVQFDGLEPAAWTVADQVDYLLVRAELDLLHYGLHIYRAPSRSPQFYLSSISSFGLSSGATLSRLGQLVLQPAPFDAARTRQVIAHMRAIPGILDQAKLNLTEPTQEMSRWALPVLADALRNSRQFAEGLAPHVPPADAGELGRAAEEMGRALEDYRHWIERRLPTMARAEPVGRELYNWLLRRVWLVPYDAEVILQLAEHEYARYLSFTSFEEARNRRVPWPRRANTTAEYAARTESDEHRIRAFLADTGVLTVPEFIGPYRRTLMPLYLQAFSLWAALSGYSLPENGVMKYSVPENHPYTSTYWEAIMRTDASTNIFHDGIPGHHFQGVISARHVSPIRSRRADRFKSEGWATYWEETAVQLGFYDDRPRSRELMYNFLRLRALRVIVDVRMALGDMTAEEGTALLMTVPMDRRIASEEADDFFAAPTGGIVYQIGKIQIEHLLGERRRQLGPRFDLKQFHDELVQAAWVPLELTRWEMTGEGDRARRMLEDRTPMPRPATPR